MKSIPKTTSTSINTTMKAMTEKVTSINTLIGMFNTRVTTLTEELNSLRQSAYEKLDQLASDAEAYYDEKSETWQDGDNGQLYAEWRSQIEEARDMLEEVFAEPCEEEYDIQGIIDAWDNVPNSPS
jgi:chromosome segregation ATPase